MRTGRKKKRYNQGYTLVELIVTFALLLLLLSATIMVLRPSLEIFLRMNSLNQSMTTMDTLMEKIEGEIQSASLVELNTSGITPVVLSYVDKNGNTVDIQKADVDDAESDYLHFIYRSEGGGNDTDWFFPTETYMRNIVKEFSITQEMIPEGRKPVFKIHLVLENTKTGKTYERNKVVEATNISP